MSLRDDGQVPVDGIRTKESYVGRRSGKKIVVTMVEMSFVKYHYVYDNGRRMTADQEISRTDFTRKFCRATIRAQELL